MTSFAKPLEDLRSHLHLEVAFRFLSKAFYVEGARHNKIVKKGDIMNKLAVKQLAVIFMKTFFSDPVSICFTRTIKVYHMLNKDTRIKPSVRVSSNPK